MQCTALPQLNQLVNLVKIYSTGPRVLQHLQECKLQAIWWIYMKNTCKKHVHMYKILHKQKFSTSFPKICVYLLTYFCMHFLHACFTPVFPHVICMQCGGLTCKKHVCNAAMPMACSV